jgi:hypothetical protein
MIEPVAGMWMVPGEARTYTEKELDEAKAWLGG